MHENVFAAEMALVNHPRTLPDIAGRNRVRLPSPPRFISCSLLGYYVSAISQNQPGIIEIKGLKTSHFKESKTAPRDLEQTGSMGHVECPQSEPANNDLQPGQSWMVAATNCERVGDQSRNGTPVSAASKTGHFDHRL